MVKLYNKTIVDYTTTQNEKEWLISIEHEVETKEDLLFFFEIFSFLIQDSFNAILTEVPTELFEKYILKRKCKLTFKYDDSSLRLSCGNMFNFTLN